MLVCVFVIVTVGVFVDVGVIVGVTDEHVVTGAIPVVTHPRLSITFNMYASDVL